MALIKCKECGHDVSDKASACPNCGCPIEHTTGKVVSCPEEEQSKEGANVKSPNCDTPAKPETGNAVDGPAKPETGNAVDTPAKPEADNVAENSMGKGDKNDDTLMRNGIIAIVVITVVGVLALQFHNSAYTTDDTAVRETVENTSTKTTASTAKKTNVSTTKKTSTKEEEYPTTWVYPIVKDDLTGNVSAINANVVSINRVEYTRGIRVRLGINLSFTSIVGSYYQTFLMIMMFGDNDLCKFSEIQGSGILVRFDNGEVDDTWRSLYMTPSRRCLSTTTTESEKALDFVQKTKKAKNLKIQVNLENIGNKTFEFNVAGLKWDSKS